MPSSSSHETEFIMFSGWGNTYVPAKWYKFGGDNEYSRATELPEYSKNV